MIACKDCGGEMKPTFAPALMECSSCSRTAEIFSMKKGQFIGSSEVSPISIDMKI